jgi:antirestriction protein ArdC
MLCGNAGIEQVTLDNSTAYIQSWLKALRNDKRMIIYAAGQAQKAVDYIMGQA